MKWFTLAALVLFLAVPAFAAEDGGKGGKPGTNVQMDYLMAPLTGAAGKLIGYAYITSRLTAASEAFVVPVRDKLPFIQDAFVRDVNTRGVATAADPQAVDVAALETRLLADAVKIMGPGKVKQITVCTVNIAELHPRKTPSPEPADAHRDTDEHNNPVKSRCEPDKAEASEKAEKHH
jgi:hypothetical protein